MADLSKAAFENDPGSIIYVAGMAGSGVGDEPPKPAQANGKGDPSGVDLTKGYFDNLGGQTGATAAAQGASGPDALTAAPTNSGFSPGEAEAEQEYDDDDDEGAGVGDPASLDKPAQANGGWDMSKFDPNKGYFGNLDAQNAEAKPQAGTTSPAVTTAMPPAAAGANDDRGMAAFEMLGAIGNKVEQEAVANSVSGRMTPEEAAAMRAPSPPPPEPPPEPGGTIGVGGASGGGDAQ